MNKQSALTAVFFVLAAIVFGAQALDNLFHFNLFVLVFNGAAAFFTGRIAYKRVKELVATI